MANDLSLDESFRALSLQSTVQIGDEAAGSNQGQANRPFLRAFSRIADEVGDENLSAFGTSLGVSDKEIEQAREENNGGLESRGTLNMLERVHTSNTSAMFDNLRRALQAIGRSDLIENLPGEFCKPEDKIRKALRQHAGKFFDIFLLTSGKKEDESKFMDIANRNKWTVNTVKKFKLGMPVLKSIEIALATCTYLVVMICEEDCKLEDTERSLTIEMAFQDAKPVLSDKIIPIRCCDSGYVSLKFKALRTVDINDEQLEERLKENIRPGKGDGKELN